MYETIRRTPQDLRDIVARGSDDIARAAAMLSGEGRVFCIGTGTSYHAALNAGFQLRRSGVDARSWASFDFATYSPGFRHGDVALLFAHTGTTGYTNRGLRAAAAAGVPVVVVCSLEANVEGATLLLRTVAPEKSAAYTASHTAALFVTAQVAATVARRRGHPAAADADFGAVPALVEDAIAREPEAAAFAEYALARRTFCAGSGPDGVLALEAALKARETAYTSIDALPTEQFIHGPMVTVNPEDAAILVATDDPGRARTRELLTITDAIGMRSWVIGSLPEPPPSAAAFEVPDLDPLLAPVVAIIPLQLFACYSAHLKDTNADSFRGDVPEYKQAWDALEF
jgi:glucosamine--fructose-6-phosphate aminotransferase (isomerizing)